MTDRSNHNALLSSSPRDEEEDSVHSDMATKQALSKHKNATTKNYESPSEQEETTGHDNDSHCAQRGDNDNNAADVSSQQHFNNDNDSHCAQRGGSNNDNSAAEQHSPTTSVSVSSVAPTLVSALLEQHTAPAGTQFPFDLTPVTRNTSTTQNAEDFSVAAATVGVHRNALEHYTLPKPRVVQDAAARVSLDDNLVAPQMPTTTTTAAAEASLSHHGVDHEGGIVLLHVSDSNHDNHNDNNKEHLSLPSDLAHKDGNISNNSLPPLRVSASGRSQSCTVHTLAQHHQHQHNPASAHSEIAVPVLRQARRDPPPHHTNHPTAALRPVPFPSRTKYYSFTSRQQYEETASDAATTNGLDMSEGHYYEHHPEENKDPCQHGSPLHCHHGLTPYQPTRPDDAMLEVPPEEELEQIFCPRSDSAHNNKFDAEKPHRLGLPLPLHVSSNPGTCHAAFSNPNNTAMMERQDSGGGFGGVPSLHLANRLGSAGTTATGDNASITTHTTLNTLEYDDDFLLHTSHGHGGASWSSSLHEDDDDDALLKEEETTQLAEDDEQQPGESTLQAPQKKKHHHRHTSSETPSVIVEGLDDELVLGGGVGGERHDDQDDDNDTAEENAPHCRPSVSDNDTTMAVDGRHQKEVEALEWLHSLQLEPQIAEAASSKFLLNKHHNTEVVHSSPTRRASSPVLP